MDELIRQYPTKVATLAALIVAAVLGGLHKMGMLRLRRKDNGHEKPCTLHPEMEKRVCSLSVKLDQIDGKLDLVSEKMNYMLGQVDARWGAKSK